MKPLTQCEEDILVYLKGCERCPSIDEIADALGKAKSHVHRVLVQLEAKGFIADIAPHTKKRMARSLVLTPLAEAHDYNPFHADLTRIPTSALVAEIQQREAA
jgi:DNA-binding MarR family transcriptional regulator